VQVVYRRYASLYVLAGVDADENALAALELMHAYVEALDKYFGAVFELDIMIHLEKAHYILDEMVMNGAWLQA
jgi:AP-4 complex subunit sigma-1